MATSVARVTSVALVRVWPANGIDLSTVAIERAQGRAAELEVTTARFAVADATRIGEAGVSYDTVLDVESRARYVQSLLDAVRPGGHVHVLALSDEGPGFGPEVGEGEIRTAFAGDSWELEDLTRVTYRGIFGPGGTQGELPAWLARIRRR